MPASDPEPAPPIRIVAGLGNPGKRYEATRHNVGFMVLDRLSEAFTDGWKDEQKWETKLVRDGDRFFLKPQTFMNASGQAVAAVAHFYKIAPEQILIVYDDADLPLGRLRFRESGSSGGHNGLKSIIAALGGAQFPRLKIGIGRTADASPGIVKHVLGKFASDEAELLETSLQKAVLAVESALTHGLATAMNEFNRKEPSKPKPQSKPELTNQGTNQPEATASETSHAEASEPHHDE